jgi:hypothetical protein
MRYNRLHHIHKMLQNCWRKSFLNTQNPGASGRGASFPGTPYQHPLETLSDPQTPRRLSSPPNTKSWIRPWYSQLIMIYCVTNVINSSTIHVLMPFYYVIHQDFCRDVIWLNPITFTVHWEIWLNMNCNVVFVNHVILTSLEKMTWKYNSVSSVVILFIDIANHFKIQLQT